MKRHLLLFLFILLSGAGVLRAQENKGRYSAKALYVKLADDGIYTVSDGRLFINGAPALPSLEPFGRWRKVHQLPDESLRRLRENAARNLGRPLPDPAASFHFILHDPARLGQAMDLLRASKDVQKVLRIPMGTNAQAPDYTFLQRYLNTEPTGIDVDTVRKWYGSKGAGVKVCDIEYDFNSQHADLPPVTWLGPAPAYTDDNHGTAVLGELCSKDNGEGTTGIAPDASCYFATCYSLPDTIYDLEAPIVSVAALFSPGDVILLEQQLYGPNYDTVNGPVTQEGMVPVEWYEPYYNAIVLAVGNNITVVEAAGNGQQNLDDTVYQTGNGGHYPFLPGHSSGALMVGAGGVGPSRGGREAERATLWFSNYGTRVDVQGNGERVTTTGYGAVYSLEGVNKFYTNDFGGTSSASPIVAGAVALLQSVSRQRTGQAMSPAQVRSVLINTGKLQQDGYSATAAAKHIGPLPATYAALRSLFPNAVPAVAAPGLVRVYPNPASGNVTVILPEDECELRICNMLGVVVRSYRLGKNERRLDADLRDLANGRYELRVANSRFVSQQSLVLAR